MSVLKVITINILKDMYLWEKRRDLLVQGLAAHNADVIAIQEVRLPQNTAQWLAEQLDFPHIYLSRKLGIEGYREGIAILSRLPFEHSETIDLHGQSRIAQYIQVRLEEQPIIVANGHFFLQPGESLVRLRQVRRLIEWLRSIPGRPPCIVCGDFNGTPETRAIHHMRSEFTSAHAAIHGFEPEYTSPTRLPHSAGMTVRSVLRYSSVLRPWHISHKWHGTLDYIFVDPCLKVLDCQVILNRPAPDNPKLFPSDHFGLYASIQMR